MVAWRRALLIAAGSLLAALTSCSKPTEVTVVVESDLGCEALRGVSITASKPDDVDIKAPDAVTTKCRPTATGSHIGSLVIAPGSANDAPLAIRVVAGIERSVGECSSLDGFRGCVIARRLLTFVEGSRLTVVVPVRAACLSMPCGPGATCVSGACASASVDPARCAGAGCDETALGTAVPPADAGATNDGEAIVPDATSPGGCAFDEKRCDGRCVKQNDPHFGCSADRCDTCPGDSIATSICDGAKCTVVSCGVGFKLCGGNCVPADPAHGCNAQSCTPCESTNGTAQCTPGGTCTIECNAGTKLCGGRCVRVDDPTYGCSATGCSAQACPSPGNGTLVCNGSTCEIGTCGAGTKQCGSACVPTDANNGCQQANRCSPCSAGDVCTGTPTSCTCVPEPANVTCATKACGAATNNCGQTVNCPNTCPGGTTCGGGGAGPNACGCTPDNTTACAGKACGPATNNCGTTITCPDTCGGGVCGAGGVGPNACCVPDNAAACAGKACGPATNNCGQAITCPNTCTGYNKCGGGTGGPNACGCTPIPKAIACEEPCGSAYNGCGGYWSCGTRICP